jgi:hypothetical protein
MGRLPVSQPRRRAVTARLAAVGLLALLVGVVLTDRASAAGAGETARVDANGSCLRLRDAPSLSATRLTCLPDGSFVTLLSDEVVEADGHRWREIEAGTWQGWGSESFLAFGDAEGEGNGQSTDGPATITYYYCEQGENELAWGDGGGFCGLLASGQPVYEGAAACAPENFGQRFRIVGDPLDLVYTCDDTGSAVAGGHRDIWFHNSDDGFDWVSQVGHRAEVIIVDSDGTAPHVATGEFTPEPSPGGLTLAMFDGDVDQLREAGEALALTTCFATVEGAFVGYTFGAPEFLNASFTAQFGEALIGRPLICRR